MTDAEKYRESIAMHYYGIVRDFVYDRLWPMLSTLEGRVSAIYSHLASRGCTLPSTPDTAHLLATVKQLDGRKVECYETDGIEDGESIVPYLLSNSYKNKLRTLIDRSSGWTLNTNPPSGLSKVVLGCSYLPSDAIQFLSNSDWNEIELPNLISNAWGSNHRYLLCSLPNIKKINLPQLKSFQGDGAQLLYNCSNLEEIYLPSLETTQYSTYSFTALPKLKKVVFGKWPRIAYRFGQSGAGYSIIPQASNGIFKDSPLLMHLEIGEGSTGSIYLTYWSPTLTDDNLSTFLSNFEQYIVRRLADLTGKTAQTLTLSTAVYNAISASTAVAHNSDGSTMYATADYSDFGTYDEAAGRTTAVTLLKALEKKQNWNVANA